MQAFVSNRLITDKAACSSGDLAAVNWQAVADWVSIQRFAKQALA